jgi:hypothetical protein
LAVFVCFAYFVCFACFVSVVVAVLAEGVAGFVVADFVVVADFGFGFVGRFDFGIDSVAGVEGMIVVGSHSPGEL